MSDPGVVYKGLTSEQAWEFKKQREAADTAVSDYSSISDEAGVDRIFASLEEAENIVAPDDNYEEASAIKENDLLVVQGVSPTVLTAEHATKQFRNDKRKEADKGTGGLALLVAEETDSSAIIARGHQTGDANYATGSHPVKVALAEMIAVPEIQAHLALHMLDRGRAPEPSDYRGYSVLLGVGDKPSDATTALADYMVGIAKDLDLRIGINQPHVIFENGTHKLLLNEDGSLKTVTFAARGPNTTRTFAQATAEALDKGAFATMQLEINEVLLVRQNDDPGFPTNWDRKLGSYLGYLFTKLAVESVAKL